MSTRKQIIEFNSISSPTSGDMFITQNVATSAASSISFTDLSTSVQSNININFRRVLQTITQNGHGFTAGQVVRFNGTYWELALADTASHSEALGIIESTTLNTFVLVSEGYISIPTAVWVPGTVYFLSPTVSGAIQTTEPTVGGQISKPMLLALSLTEAIVYSMRATIISSVAVVDISSNQSISGTKAFYNTVYVGAGINNNFLVLSGDREVSTTDYTLVCDTSSISGNLTLPFNPINGETHRVKCVGSYNVNVNNNTRNIDGINGSIILTPGQSVELLYTGTSVGWAKL